MKRTYTDEDIQNFLGGVTLPDGYRQGKLGIRKKYLDEKDTRNFLPIYLSYNNFEYDGLEILVQNLNFSIYRLDGCCSDDYELHFVKDCSIDWITYLIKEHPELKEYYEELIEHTIDELHNEKEDKKRLLQMKYEKEAKKIDKEYDNRIKMQGYLYEIVSKTNSKENENTL